MRLPRGVSEVEIVVAGCLHIGHRGCNEGAIREMVAYVRAAPHRRLILLGDVTDGISVSDHRFNPREVASWLATEDLSNRILLEAERACAILKPVADRIDGLIEGNHERKPRSVSQVDLHRVLWKGLGIESLGTMAFLRYRFVGRDRGEAEPVTLYCEHGAGGASMVGNVLNKMVKKAAEFPGCDIYLGAHHHRNGATVAENVQLVGGNLKRGAPLVATVGTFLMYHRKDQDSYGEYFAMSPHDLGPGKVTLRPWARPEQRVGYAFPYFS